MIVLQILLYFIALTVIGALLMFISGWLTYCDPADDIKRAISFIRKRSWEK